jgi:hypothetical protein
MYCTLTRVIMRRDGEGKQETKPCNAREPWLTKSARGGQEPEAHFMQTDLLGLSYTRGLAPHHGALQQ